MGYLWGFALLRFIIALVGFNMAYFGAMLIGRDFPGPGSAGMGIIPDPAPHHKFAFFSNVLYMVIGVYLD